MRKAAAAALSLLDPRVYLHGLRLLHYYNYAHVREARCVRLGKGAFIAPNASLRNGCLIRIGARTHVGERCYLWAGETTGLIDIGKDTLLGPEVFVIASNYGLDRDQLIMSQPKLEAPVVVGDDVWLGARSILLAGARIGNGSVIGAGSVVTGLIPPYSVAAGVPARLIRGRGTEPSGAVSETMVDIDARVGT